MEYKQNWHTTYLDDLTGSFDRMQGAHQMQM